MNADAGENVICRAARPHLQIETADLASRLVLEDDLDLWSVRTNVSTRLGIMLVLLIVPSAIGRSSRAGLLR